MPKKIANSFIALFDMTKGLMDDNEQLSVKQELERIFSSISRIGESSGTRSSVVNNDLANLFCFEPFQFKGKTTNFVQTMTPH